MYSDKNQAWQVSSKLEIHEIHKSFKLFFSSFWATVLAPHPPNNERVGYSGPSSGNIYIDFVLLSAKSIGPLSVFSLKENGPPKNLMGHFLLSAAF